MFGCLLGAILFNKDPYLFYGSSNQVLLASIVWISLSVFEHRTSS